MHETNPTFKGIVMSSDDRIFIFECTFFLNAFKCAAEIRLQLVLIWLLKWLWIEYKFSIYALYHFYMDRQNKAVAWLHIFQVCM